MRRRLIALKATADNWLYAIAHNDGKETRLLKTGRLPCSEGESPATPFETICAGQHFSDRLATLLPADAGLSRWLSFPFHETRKIATATPAELTRLLPESTTRLIHHQVQNDGRVLAVAVEQRKLETLLDEFQAEELPLSFVGLAPFCYLDALSWPEEGLVLCRDDDALSLCRIENGQLSDLRLMPQTSLNDLDAILTQTQLLARCGKKPVLNIGLLGIAEDEPLAERLEDAGFDVSLIQLDSEEGQVEADLIPLATLALSAANARGTSFNLRSGAYKFRNEWQGLKKRLWLAAGMLFLAAALFVTSSVLQVQQRKQELARLQQQLTQRYQKAFPGEKLVASAPMQLQSKIMALQKKAEMSGIDRTGSLDILQQVSSAISPDLSIEIREYLLNNEGLRLNGTTNSFDAISQLISSLQKVDLFSEVRMLDSKQANDGSRVDFQLQLDLKRGGGA